MAEDFSDVQGGGSSNAPGSARTYTVKSGDSLSKIAREFYGDMKKWPQIFDANRDRITDPDMIKPGQTLRIP